MEEIPNTNNNMMSIPLQIVISGAKKGIRDYIFKTMEDSKLPNYIMDGILVDILSEIRNSELDSMIELISKNRPDEKI